MTEVSTHLTRTIASTLKLMFWLLLAGFLLYLSSGIFSVEPGQIGVHTRFGSVIVPKELPGIHLGLPYPFDKVYLVPIKRMKTAIINDFSPDTTMGLFPATFTVLTDIPVYCITGDDNIVTLSCSIQYNIVNASQYLFKTINPEAILREMAKSAIIHCIAGMKVDTVLTTGKKDIADFIKAKLNHKLSMLETGLQAQFVELKSVTPPEKVKKDFEEVIKARMDKKKSVDNAESYRNQKLSSANAEAEKLIQKSLAYQYNQVTKSKGEADRFLNRLSEYEKNPALIRKKQFLDFLQSMGQNWPNKIIVDTSSGHDPVRLRIAWPK